MNQFLEWNPAISSDCRDNFWLDSAYCVRGRTGQPQTYHHHHLHLYFQGRVPDNHQLSLSDVPNLVQLDLLNLAPRHIVEHFGHE